MIIIYCSFHQLKKRRLKEKIEADVGALVQFLLDERDSLLESLDAEEVATMAVINDNLKTVEVEAAAVDKAIADIHAHISGKSSFEVSLIIFRFILKSQCFYSIFKVKMNKII